MEKSANTFYPVPASICNMDILWIIGLCALIVGDTIALGPVLAKGSASELFQFYNSEGIRCGKDKALE